MLLRRQRNRRRRRARVDHGFSFPGGFWFLRRKLAQPATYRTSGLEYVDIIRAQAEEHAVLTRSLNQIRLREFSAQLQRSRSNAQAQAALAPLDQFATAFSDAGDGLNGLVSDLNDEAMGLKEALAQRDEAIAERDRLQRAGETAAAIKIAVPAVDTTATVANLRASAPIFRLTSSTVAAQLSGLLNGAPPSPLRGHGNCSLPGRNGSAIIWQRCPPLTKSLKAGIPPARSRGIAASPRFSSGATGSRPVSGRIGTASAHC